MSTEFKNVDHSRFAKEPERYYAPTPNGAYKFLCVKATQAPVGTNFSCLVAIVQDGKTVRHMTVEQINSSSYAVSYNNWLAQNWVKTKGDKAPAALRYYRLKVPSTWQSDQFKAVEAVIARDPKEAYSYVTALRAKNASHVVSEVVQVAYNKHIQANKPLPEFTVLSRFGNVAEIGLTNFDCLIMRRTNGNNYYFSLETINQTAGLAKQFNDWFATQGVNEWMKLSPGTGSALTRLCNYMDNLRTISVKPVDGIQFSAVEQEIAKDGNTASIYYDLQVARSNGFFNFTPNIIMARNNFVVAQAAARKAEYERQALLAMLAPTPKPAPQMTLGAMGGLPIYGTAKPAVPFYTLLLPKQKRGRDMKFTPNMFSDAQIAHIRNAIGDQLVSSKLLSMVVITKNTRSGKVLAAMSMETVNRNQTYAVGFNTFVAQTKSLAWINGYMTKLNMRPIYTGQFSNVEAALAKSPQYAHEYIARMQKLGMPANWSWTLSATAAKYAPELAKQQNAAAEKARNSSFYWNMLPALICLLACLFTVVLFIKSHSIPYGLTSALSFGATLFWTGRFIKDTKGLPTEKIVV